MFSLRIKLAYLGVGERRLVIQRAPLKADTSGAGRGEDAVRCVVGYPRLSFFNSRTPRSPK